MAYRQRPVQIFAGGRRLRPKSRRCRNRRHHIMYQHFKSGCYACSGAFGKERKKAWIGVKPWVKTLLLQVQE